MNILRQFLPLSRSFNRGLPSKESLVDLSVDPKSIAMISLKRLPGNSLNLEFLQGLRSAIDVVQKNMQGIGLTSSFNILRRPLIRGMSSKESSVGLSVDREGIALITIKRPPVNSLNLELIQEISGAVDQVQKNQCKGLVLTSGVKIFSAGLDLNELNKPDDLNRLRAFWSKSLDLFLKIYGSGEITTTAAINGYTAAGGCIISLLCDYRVMVADSKAKIGINDTAVGIVPRPWLCDVMAQVMGHRQAEIAVTASTMYSVEEALKVNIIDEIATDKKDAIEKCKQFIRRYDNIPVKIKAKAKRRVRENTIRLLESNKEEELKMFIEGILDPYVQEHIAVYLQQLKSKKK